MSRRAAAPWLGILMTLAVLAIAAFVLPRALDDYRLRVVDLALINIVLALGLNFILGFGGQISLAQAAFFGIGAYGFAILDKAGLDAASAALLAVLVTGALGLALGWPTLRLKGHYLALATLAFTLITGQLLINLSWLTGGADGLSGIKGVGLAGRYDTMLDVLLVLAGLAFLVSLLFARSPLGLRVRAFRDDEVAARAVGIRTDRLKVMLFTISAVYAGMAGVAYASLLGYISPDAFAWQTTFSYLAMTVVGGLGSSFGVVLGAILYTFLPEGLRFLQEAYYAIFGLLVIVIIVAAPGGIAGLLARLGRQLRPGRQVAVAAPSAGPATVLGTRSAPP